jgi:hypothetical protein
MAARPPPRLVTPGPGTHILRDVGGVPGLSVLTEAFTEDCERRYWDAAPGSGNQSAGETKRVGQCSIDHPLAMFGAVHEAISLVEDTGLFAPICRPDYILVQAYPPKASFMSHYDSKFRWGETVVGVCLGAPCEMLFTPNDKSLPNVRVWLPRRSIYVMAGDSRRLWKHGLFRAGMAGLEGREQARPPSFNPLNWRRSWTLRSTKVYQQAWLESRRDAAPAGSAARAALSARLAAQLEFMPPQAGGPHEKLVGADFDAVHAQAVAMLADVDRSPAPRVRMRAADAGASLVAQLRADAALPAASYYIALNERRWRYDAVEAGRLDLTHFLVLTRVGDAGALLMSYERHYTLGEWLQYDTPLAPHASGGPRVAVLPSPRFRGLLPPAALAEAAAALDRLSQYDTFSDAARSDYADLTGVAIRDGPAEAGRRLDLTWLRMAAMPPEPQLWRSP